MEIPVQAMDTTSLEVGLSDRIYLGNSTLYLRLAHRQGMGWLGAQKESPYSDGPKTRYKMWLVDMDYKSPSPWAGGPPHGRHLSMASGIQQETGSMGWTW